jgi:hypothetical protein
VVPMMMLPVAKNDARLFGAGARYDFQFARISQFSQKLK